MNVHVANSIHMPVIIITFCKIFFDNVLIYDKSCIQIASICKYSFKHKSNLSTTAPKIFTTQLCTLLHHFEICINEFLSGCQFEMQKLNTKLPYQCKYEYVVNSKAVYPLYGTICMP